MKVDKSNNHAYNKSLQPLANKLRKDMTKAEACLWKYALRAKQMKGYNFRRERPVMNYITDFMCMDLKLVIEVDGLSHQWEETQDKDNKKDSDLEAAGYKVLRFSDEEVLKNMSGVIKRIEFAMEEIQKQIHPPPTPASGGQV